MSLHSEIFEQPACVERLLRSQRQQVEEIARAIRSRDVQYAFVATRGTSDNAARYGNYLWSAMNGLPMALATPSLFTYYEQPPRLQGALVVGVSQSGKSPDIVSVLAEGKRQGCLTLAITNIADSPLAQMADFVLDIQAGEEKAVAATKTYTTELMALAMISVALSEYTHGDYRERWQDLARLPDWMEEALKLDTAIGERVQRYRYMDQCVVLGRGYNYATAFEWALKLKELTYVEAEPYSSADFQHGPIAMVESGFPVMAVVPQGKVYASMLDVLRQLRDVHAAELVVLSDAPEALALGNSSFALPVGMPEWLTPIVSIVPGQLFAYHLTRAKGFDTEKPRSIRKVTETH